MYYLGVAVDASNREVRFVALRVANPEAMPEFRTLAYGEHDVPAAMRDLHAATLSTLGELPAEAVAVRRMDPPPPRRSPNGSGGGLRTATVDRLLAEGAVLAAAREAAEIVNHVTGQDAAARLGLQSKDDALKAAKAFLKGHGQPVTKWSEATMVAQTLTQPGRASTIPANEEAPYS